MDRLSLAPPAAPRAMPVQRLDRALPKALMRAPLHVPPRVLFARILLAVLVVTLTSYGLHVLYGAAKVGGMIPLEWVLLCVFALAFAWIAFSAGNAIVGLCLPYRRRPGQPSGERGRTALVMPVYNEDPSRTFAGLAAMVGDIPHHRRADFEVFVLSDTNNPELWIAEEKAVTILRSLSAHVPVWYRRRFDNEDRKAGNVAEFVRRWGGRYAHMIVLDADSLMTGACLCALRDAMLEDADAGIIQTAPKLIGAETPYAKAQQFANAVQGPVVADGLAAWQGDDGNFWGHNAIIRMEAFASAAGLPKLSGKPPFGGSVLSHDFVEAALVRRAGWTVTLRTDLDGSYEGAPPDLFGVIRRDRRWAQGNLQHAKVIATPGLAFASRAHFAIGILSYLMSPVWLILILTGVALSIYATLRRPEYFPDAFALFPTWPAFDAERMVALLVLSLGVLLVPKAIALARALAHQPTRRGAGGPVKLAASTLTELAFSTLVAPIMMVAQSGIVASIALGRAVGWAPQTRGTAGVRWVEAARFHAIHMATGVALTVVAVMHSPLLATWMSPTLLALVLAVPLSKAGASPRAGRLLRRFGLMLTPQERAPPQIALDAERLAEHFPAPPSDALIALAKDSELVGIHRSLLPRRTRGRGAIDANSALAAAKLTEAHSLAELSGWLSPAERLSLLSDPSLLARALALAGDRDAKVA